MDTGKKNAGHGGAVAALARSLALFLLLDIKTLIKATIRTYRPCLVDPKTIFFLKKNFSHIELYGTRMKH
jgi:hypothetical protein